MGLKHLDSYKLFLRLNASRVKNKTIKNLNYNLKVAPMRFTVKI